MINVNREDLTGYTVYFKLGEGKLRQRGFLLFFASMLLTGDWVSHDVITD